MRKPGWIKASGWWMEKGWEIRTSDKARMMRENMNPLVVEWVEG